jgi:hypothetical protein
MNAMFISPGRTFPVEELFLEDILDKIDYVIEENNSNTRNIVKSRRPGDMESLECELEMTDIQASRSDIQSQDTPDEKLTTSQLCCRYKSKFCNVTLFVHKFSIMCSHVILLEIRELNNVIQ